MRALADEQLVDAVLSDYRSAPITDRLRDTLGFLEALTVRPEALTPRDLAGAREAGVSDAALHDAVHVCAAFAVLNKLADAFGWELLDDATFDERARASVERGYELPARLLE